MSNRPFAALLAGAVLIAFAACGTTGVTVGASDSRGEYDTSASASTVIGSDQRSGAGELDVDILMVDPPPAVMGEHEVHLLYVFNIHNRSEGPATLKSIYVATAGGDYELETRTRKYDKVIEAGAMEKVEFLARATGIDQRVGAKNPQTIRAKVSYLTAAGPKSATFTRNVGSTVNVTGFKDQ